MSHVATGRLWVGVGLLAAIALLALIGPGLDGWPAGQVHLALANLPPGARHPFGTDALGRDTFSRTWQGARLSLLVGLAAVLLDLGVGAVYGALAGFAGGALDQALMRVVDVLYGVPSLLVAIFLVTVRGPGLGTLILAIATVNWLGMARLVRGQVLSLRRREWVLASRGLGLRPSQVLWRHVLPHVAGPALAWLSFSLPQAIFAEAFLSFLGLGVQPPLASWGSLISLGSASLLINPYPLLFPSAALVLTLLGCHLVADGLGADGARP